MIVGSVSSTVNVTVVTFPAWSVAVTVYVPSPVTVEPFVITVSPNWSVASVASSTSIVTPDL